MSGLRRVYLPELARGARQLDADAAKYVARVLRLGLGDRFVVFDPETRREADAEIVGASGRALRVEIGPVRERPASGPPLALMQALGKGDKLDRVIRDATALSVTRIVVVESEFSVVHLDESRRSERRRERWRAIAAQAARQSERADVPEIEGPLPVEAALGLFEGMRRLWLDARAGEPLSRALAGLGPDEPLAIAIGPEGGWSSSEAELAARHGFSSVRFGELVLRTETAATAVLGALLLARAGSSAPA